MQERHEKGLGNLKKEQFADLINYYKYLLVEWDKYNLYQVFKENKYQVAQNHLSDTQKTEMNTLFSSLDEIHRSNALKNSSNELQHYIDKVSNILGIKLPLNPADEMRLRNELKRLESKYRFEDNSPSNEALEKANKELLTQAAEFKNATVALEKANLDLKKAKMAHRTASDTLKKQENAVVIEDMKDAATENLEKMKVAQETATENLEKMKVAQKAAAENLNKIGDAQKAALLKQETARKAIELPIDTFMSALNIKLADPQLSTAEKLEYLQKTLLEIKSMRALNVLLLKLNEHDPDPELYAKAVDSPLSFRMANADGQISLQNVETFLSSQITDAENKLREIKEQQKENERLAAAEKMRAAERLKEEEKIKEAERVKAEEKEKEIEEKTEKELGEIGEKFGDIMRKAGYLLDDSKAMNRYFAEADARLDAQLSKMLEETAQTIQSTYETHYNDLIPHIEKFNTRANNEQLATPDPAIRPPVLVQLDAQIQKLQAVIAYLETKKALTDPDKKAHFDTLREDAQNKLKQLVDKKAEIDAEIKKPIDLPNSQILAELIRLKAEHRTKELKLKELNAVLPPLSRRDLKKAADDLESTRVALEFFESNFSINLPLDAEKTKELITQFNQLVQKQEELKTIADPTIKAAFKSIETELLAYSKDRDPAHLEQIKTHFTAIDSRAALIRDVDALNIERNKLLRNIADLKHQALSKDMNETEIEQFIDKYVTLHIKLNEHTIKINNTNETLNNNSPPIPLVKPEETKRNALEEIHRKYPKLSIDSPEQLKAKLHELSQTKQQLIQLTIPAVLGADLHSVLSTLQNPPFDKLVITGTIANLPQLLENLAKAGVKAIELQEITPAQLAQLPQLIQDKKIACDILLPDAHRKNKEQLNIDRIISLNRRAENLNPQEKANQATEPQGEGLRIRDRIKLLSPSISVEMQQESQQESQVQVQVAVALETESEAKVQHPIPGPDDVVDRTQYLALHNKAVGDWDVWFGNIHLLRVPKVVPEFGALTADNTDKVIDLCVKPDAASDYPEGKEELYENKNISKLSKKALAHIEQHAQQFKYGLDFNNLPAGFILIPEFTDPNEPEKTYILDYSAELASSQTADRPMAVNLSDKPKPYVMSTFLLDAWLNKEPKSPAELSLAEKYQHLAQGNQYDRAQLDQLKIDILSELGKDIAGTRTTKNHFIYSLIDDKQLVKDLKSLDLTNAQLASCLAVLDEHGSKALAQVVSFIKNASDKTMMNEVLTHHQSNGSFAFLLDDTARGQINAMMNLEPAERAWWNELYKAHCANVGSDDFFALAQNFNYFVKEMRAYAASIGITDLDFSAKPDFSQVKNMQVALSRMSVLMHQCDPNEFALQWKGLTQLDLQSNGAIRLLSEVRDKKALFKLVTPEIQATPVHFAPMHDINLGLAANGYSSLAVTTFKNGDSRAISRVRKGNPWDPSGFDHITASGDQAELERNFYRFVQSAPISRSAQFYRNAAKQIEDFKPGGVANDDNTIFEFKKVLYALVAFANTGLDNVANLSDADAEKFTAVLIDRYKEMKTTSLGLASIDLRPQLFAEAILCAPRLFRVLPAEHYNEMIGIVLKTYEFSVTDMMSEKKSDEITERQANVSSAFNQIANLDFIKGVLPFMKGLAALGQKYTYELIDKYGTQARAISRTDLFKDDDQSKRNLITLIGTFKFLDLKPDLLEYVTEKMNGLSFSEVIAFKAALEFMANMESPELNKEVFDEIIAAVLLATKDINDPNLFKEKIKSLMQDKYARYFKENYFASSNKVAISNELVAAANDQFNARDALIIQKLFKTFTNPADLDLLKPLISKIAVLNKKLVQNDPDSSLLSILAQITPINSRAADLEQLVVALSKEPRLAELIIFLEEGKDFKQEEMLQKANLFMNLGLKTISQMQAQGISKTQSLSLVSQWIMSGFQTGAELDALSSLTADILKKFPADKRLLIDLLEQKALELNKRSDLKPEQKQQQLIELIDNLHSLHKQLTPDVFRSLITHEMDDIKSGAADAAKLPQLLLEINEAFADSDPNVRVATTISILGILCNLRNNKIPISLEERTTLIDMCAKNSNLIGIIEQCYKQAPYPAIRQIIEWQKQTENSADPSADFMKLYSAFSNTPCKREPGNGFKMSEAVDQRELMKIIAGKEVISTDELNSLNNAINKAKELKTTELRAQVSPPSTALSPAERVAYLAELLHRAKGSEGKPGSSFELNTTQYLAAYLFAKGDKDAARITQKIDTGEGKSRIMMIGCALEYSKGNTVDFVTSNTQLALRDYLEYKSFFSSIGAKTSFISAGSPVSDYHREHGVHFSDVTNLSLFRNQARSNNQDNLVFADETKRSLLLDEQDQTFFDSSSTKFNYSMPTKNAYGDVSWIYPLMVKFALKEEFYDLYPEEYNKQCREFIAGELGNLAKDEQTARLAQLNRIPNSQLKAWQDAAFMALSRKYGEDYKVEPNVSSATANGPQLASQVRLIHNSRTVTESKYSAGVHQCLHALLNMQLRGELGKSAPEGVIAAINECKRKAGGQAVAEFEIEPEKQIVYSTTSKSFIDDYEKGSILAVSGTTGADIEQNEVTQLFGAMDFVAMPRHNQLKREDKPLHLTKDAAARRQALVDYVIEARQNNQPVLLILETDEECALLQKLLENHDKKIPSTVLLADASSSEEERVIAQAGEPGAITISTSRMGRGTDIKLAEVAKEKGLLTLVGYLPSARELLQFIGRSGRFGAEGVTRVVCDREQVKRFIGSDTIPIGLHTATNGFIQLQQLVGARRNQSSRIVQSAISDYQAQFAKAFFEHIKDVTDPKERAKLLDRWGDFLRVCEQNWAPHGAKIIAAYSKKQEYTQGIAQEFDKFHTETKEAWSALMKDVGSITGDITGPAIRFNRVESDLESKTTMHTKYDKALAGKATVFPTLFMETKSVLNGERKFFANTRAALRGEGMVFADTIALLSGKRPIFANLRTWISTHQEIARIDKEIAVREEQVRGALLEATPQGLDMKSPLDEIVRSLNEKMQLQSGTKKQETREDLEFWKALRKVQYNEPLGKSSMTEESPNSTKEKPIYQLKQAELEKRFNQYEIMLLRNMEDRNYKQNTEKAAHIRTKLDSTSEASVLETSVPETSAQEDQTKQKAVVRTIAPESVEILLRPQPTPRDATGLVPQHNVGYSQDSNGKKYQEDAMVVRTLDPAALNNLSPQDIGNRLWTSYRVLDKDIRDIKEGKKQTVIEDGSTASTTVYDGKGNLVTATLADAVSFMVIYDTQGQVMGVVRLNSVTHKPDNVAEKARIESTGCFVSNGAVMSSLSVSRALGDHSYKEYGVTADATIDVTNIDAVLEKSGIDPRQVGSKQIITTSDGFTDGAKAQTKEGHEQYVRDILAEKGKPGLNENQVAKLLVDTAKSKSRDNITVVVHTLSEGKPALIGVYDGHGGHRAADHAAQNIGKVFTDQCALTPSAYQAQDLSIERQIKEKEAEKEKLQNELKTPTALDLDDPKNSDEVERIERIPARLAQIDVELKELKQLAQGSTTSTPAEIAERTESKPESTPTAVSAPKSLDIEQEITDLQDEFEVLSQKYSTAAANLNKLYDEKKVILNATLVNVVDTSIIDEEIKDAEQVIKDLDVQVSTVNDRLQVLYHQRAPSDPNTTTTPVVSQDTISPAAAAQLAAADKHVAQVRAQGSTISPQAAAQPTTEDKHAAEVRANAAVSIQSQIKVLETKAQKNALKYIALHAQKDDIENKRVTVTPDSLMVLLSEMKGLEQEEKALRKQIRQLDAELLRNRYPDTPPPVVASAKTATQTEIDKLEKECEQYKSKHYAISDHINAIQINGVAMKNPATKDILAKLDKEVSQLTQAIATNRAKIGELKQQPKDAVNPSTAYRGALHDIKDAGSEQDASSDKRNTPGA